jgi:hypothetical protein
VDRLAQQLTPRQVLEWRAFERIEGYPLGSRGDWYRQALAASKEGQHPQAFMPWTRSGAKGTRPFAQFKKTNPFLFKKG